MTPVPHAREKREDIRDKDEKYLGFMVAGEAYGVALSKIKEVIGVMSVKTLPGPDGHPKRFAELRGNVIPVSDLRLKFGLSAGVFTERTCIVVVEVPGGKGKRMKGLLVDSVSEVLSVRGEEIDGSPSLELPLRRECLLGTVMKGDAATILLDVDQLFE